MTKWFTSRNEAAFRAQSTAASLADHEMALWIVVAHKDFPIWPLAHRLIRRQPLDGNWVKWLLEGSWSLSGFPVSAKGVVSVESAEITY